MNDVKNIEKLEEEFKSLLDILNDKREEYDYRKHTFLENEALKEKIVNQLFFTNRFFLKSNNSVNITKSSTVLDSLEWLSRDVKLFVKGENCTLEEKLVDKIFRVDICNKTLDSSVDMYSKELSLNNDLIEKTTHKLFDARIEHVLNRDILVLKRLELDGLKFRSDCSAVNLNEELLLENTLETPLNSDSSSNIIDLENFCESDLIKGSIEDELVKEEFIGNTDLLTIKRLLSTTSGDIEFNEIFENVFEGLLNGVLYLIFDNTTKDITDLEDVFERNGDILSFRFVFTKELLCKKYFDSTNKGKFSTNLAEFILNRYDLDYINNPKSIHVQYLSGGVLDTAEYLTVANPTEYESWFDI